MDGFVDVFHFYKLIWSGFKLTISLAAMDLLLSTLIGALCALVMTAAGKNMVLKVLKAAVRIYIELFRGSPLLLQIFFIYYGLGYVGVDMPLMGSCLLSLCMHHGAYVCEILRSGIESVSKGQREAGLTLGLSRFQIMRRVILPQAFKVFLPALVGYYIGAIKDTPLVSMVGLADMVKNGKIIMGHTNAPLQTYFVIAMIYFLICYPLSLYVRHLEAKRPAV